MPRGSELGAASLPHTDPEASQRLGEPPAIHRPKSPAYLRGKNPYGRILERRRSPCQERKLITSGPPSQIGSSIEGRPRTSGSFKFKTRPPEPERMFDEAGLQAITLTPKQIPKPVSVRDRKSFFESRASENQPNAPFPTRNSNVPTSSTRRSKDEGGPSSRTSNMPALVRKDEANGSLRPSDAQATGQEDSDPGLPIPRPPPDATKRPETSQRTNPFVRHKHPPASPNIVVATASESNDNGNERTSSRRKSIKHKPEYVAEEKAALASASLVEGEASSRGRSANTFEETSRIAKDTARMRRPVGESTKLDDLSSAARAAIQGAKAFGGTRVSEEPLKRQRSRCPEAAAEFDEYAVAEEPKRTHKAGLKNADRDIRRVASQRRRRKLSKIADDCFTAQADYTPSRRRKGSRSAHEAGDEELDHIRRQSKAKFSAVDYDQDFETQVRNFGEPNITTRGWDEGGVSRGFSHDGSSNPPRVLSRRATASATVLPSVTIKEEGHDTSLDLDHSDWRGGYGRRQTKDFGFPGARTKVERSAKKSEASEDLEDWIKRSCGHSSKLEQDETRNDASTQPCRLCSTNPSCNARTETAKAARRTGRKRAASDSSVTSSSRSSRSPSPIGSWKCSKPGGRTAARRHHSEYNPTDRCGDTFAKDLGFIIDAIIMEHTNTLEQVMSNIRSSQPMLSQMRRVSQDLVDRCRESSICRTPCPPVCSMPCRPFPPCNTNQVCKYVPPCPYVPPKAVEKLNVGKPGQIGPNLNDSRSSLRDATKSVPDLIDLVNSAADDLGVDLERRPTVQDEEKFLRAPVQRNASPDHSPPGSTRISPRPTLPTVEETVVGEEQPTEDSWLQKTRRQLTELSEARSQLQDELDTIAEDLDVHLQGRRDSERELDPLERALARVSTGLSRASTRLRNKSVDTVTEETPRMLDQEINERRLSRVLTRIQDQSRRVSSISQGLQDIESIPPEQVQQWLRMAQTELPAAIDSITTVLEGLPSVESDRAVEGPRYEQEREEFYEPGDYEEVMGPPPRTYTEDIFELHDRIADLEQRMGREPSPVYSEHENGVATECMTVQPTERYETTPSRRDTMTPEPEGEVIAPETEKYDSPLAPSSVEERSVIDEQRSLSASPIMRIRASSRVPSQFERVPMQIISSAIEDERSLSPSLVMKIRATTRISSQLEREPTQVAFSAGNTEKSPTPSPSPSPPPVDTHMRIRTGSRISTQLEPEPMQVVGQEDEPAHIERRATQIERQPTRISGQSKQIERQPTHFERQPTKTLEVEAERSQTPSPVDPYTRIRAESRQPTQVLEPEEPQYISPSISVSPPPSPVSEQPPQPSRLSAQRIERLSLAEPELIHLPSSPDPVPGPVRRITTRLERQPKIAPESIEFPASPEPPISKTLTDQPPELIRRVTTRVESQATIPQDPAEYSETSSLTPSTVSEELPEPRRMATTQVERQATIQAEPSESLSSTSSEASSEPSRRVTPGVERAPTAPLDAERELGSESSSPSSIYSEHEPEAPPPRRATTVRTLTGLTGFGTSSSEPQEYTSMEHMLDRAATRRATDVMERVSTIERPPMEYEQPDLANRIAMPVSRNATEASENRSTLESKPVVDDKPEVFSRVIAPPSRRATEVWESKATISRPPTVYDDPEIISRVGIPPSRKITETMERQKTLERPPTVYHEPEVSSGFSLPPSRRATETIERTATLQRPSPVYGSPDFVEKVSLPPSRRTTLLDPTQRLEEEYSEPAPASRRASSRLSRQPTRRTTNDLSERLIADEPETERSDEEVPLFTRQSSTIPRKATTVPRKPTEIPRQPSIQTRRATLRERAPTTTQTEEEPTIERRSSRRYTTISREPMQQELSPAPPPAVSRQPTVLSRRPSAREASPSPSLTISRQPTVSRRARMRERTPSPRIDSRRSSAASKRPTEPVRSPSPPTAISRQTTTGDESPESTLPVMRMARHDTVPEENPTDSAEETSDAAMPVVIKARQMTKPEPEDDTRDVIDEEQPGEESSEDAIPMNRVASQTTELEPDHKSHDDSPSVALNRRASTNEPARAATLVTSLIPLHGPLDESIYEIIEPTTPLVRRRTGTGSLSRQPISGNQETIDEFESSPPLVRKRTTTHGEAPTAVEVVGIQRQPTVELDLEQLKELALDLNPLRQATLLQLTPEETPRPAPRRKTTRISRQPTRDPDLPAQEVTQTHPNKVFTPKARSCTNRSSRQPTRTATIPAEELTQALLELEPDQLQLEDDLPPPPKRQQTRFSEEPDSVVTIPARERVLHEEPGPSQNLPQLEEELPPEPRRIRTIPSRKPTRIATILAQELVQVDAEPESEASREGLQPTYPSGQSSVIDEPLAALEVYNAAATPVLRMAQRTSTSGEPEAEREAPKRLSRAPTSEDPGTGSEDELQRKSTRTLIRRESIRDRLPSVSEDRIQPDVEIPHRESLCGRLASVSDEVVRPEQKAVTSPEELLPTTSTLSRQPTFEVPERQATAPRYEEEATLATPNRTPTQRTIERRSTVPTESAEQTPGRLPRPPTADLGREPESLGVPVVEGSNLPNAPLAHKERRRKSSAVPGLDLTLIEAVHEAGPKPSIPRTKPRKAVAVPPEEQDPPAPAYPVRDTPAWIKPDTRTPLPKPPREPSPKAKGKKGFFGWGGKSKEEPQAVARVERPAPPPPPEPQRIRVVPQYQNPEQYRDRARAEPFRAAAPGPAPGSAPGGTLQRPRDNQPAPGYQPDYGSYPSGRRAAPARRDDFYPQPPSLPARRDNYYPQPAPVRSADYPRYAPAPAPERRDDYYSRPPPAPIRRDEALRYTAAPVRRDLYIPAPARDDYATPTTAPGYTPRSQLRSQALQSQAPEPVRYQLPSRQGRRDEEATFRGQAPPPIRRPQDDKKSVRARQIPQEETAARPVRRDVSNAPQTEEVPRAPEAGRNRRGSRQTQEELDEAPVRRNENFPRRPSRGARGSRAEPRNDSDHRPSKAVQVPAKAAQGQDPEGRRRSSVRSIEGDFESATEISEEDSEDLDTSPQPAQVPAELRSAINPNPDVPPAPPAPEETRTAPAERKPSRRGSRPADSRTKDTRSGDPNPTPRTSRPTDTRSTPSDPRPEDHDPRRRDSRATAADSSRPRAQAPRPAAPRPRDAQPGISSGESTSGDSDPRGKGAGKKQVAGKPAAGGGKGWGLGGLWGRMGK
ncbi:hypothetical protein BCR34DRAFT_47861 [Clohesyomyces aquaticus]|uniref:Uncharacterized protein n=1 Tax=Clohesyomyces aquaticus TaxID=1231657 RepID=A0A1Y1Z583_9PLEO|nr:hypothetical protein BCR34DRAFT_47861 [Clohesyomyces aquaticus]